MEAAEFDDLNEILSQWDVNEAKIVLAVIKNRLDIVKALEKLTKVKSDELHILQPLFERSLWIFGPEYDAVQYTSNKSFTTVIAEFFKPKFGKTIRERPDFVVIPNEFSFGVYTTDAFNSEGEIEGFATASKEGRTPNLISKSLL